MKKKSKKITLFIDNLHEFIAAYPGFRRSAVNVKHTDVVLDIKSLIFAYLNNYFTNCGFTNPVEKTRNSLILDRLDEHYQVDGTPVFGEICIPTFIILKPYRLAIEYRQGNRASALKEGIGQSILHTVSGRYDFAYFLFHDLNKNKRIMTSNDYRLESSIVSELWDRHNIRIKFI